MKLSAGKIVGIAILAVLILAVSIWAWPTQVVVKASAANPWQLQSMDALSVYADANAEEYSSKTTVKSKETDPDIDESKYGIAGVEYMEILRAVDFPTPWDANDDAYYAKKDILNTTIRAYYPDVTADIGKTIEPGDYFEVLVDPDLIDVDFEELSDTDKEAAKLLALALYYNANYLYINAPYSGYNSVCFTDNVAAGLHNAINLNILELRNKVGTGDTAKYDFYRQDYRVDGGVQIYSLLKKMGMSAESVNKRLDMLCAERRYANSSMSSTIYQKTGYASVNNEGQYETDWSSAPNKEPVETVYNAQQFSVLPGGTEENPVIGYQKVAHTIEFDTISAVELTSNSYGGITVKFNLNLKNKRTTAYTIDGIRDGSGDSTAKYTSIDVEFDLWENGMYRTYKSYEKWTAKVFGLALSSDFLYCDVYFYGKADCDIQKYVSTVDADGNADFIDGKTQAVAKTEYDKFHK